MTVRDYAFGVRPSAHSRVSTGGDDFYEWFLGPRMVYTSGVIGDINREESLEELQDNKLTVVCEKARHSPSSTCVY